MPSNTSTTTDFSNFYLQRATAEFAEDIDKARNADDFKADSIPFLVHALQQGSGMYSDSEQARIMKPAEVSSPAGDVEMTEESKAEEKEKKEKKKKRKSQG